MTKTFTAIFKPSVKIPDTSPKGSLDKNDFSKLTAHLLIGMGMAGATILGEYLGKVDFGVYTALAVPVLTTIIQGIKKWLTENDPKVGE